MAEEEVSMAALAPESHPGLYIWTFPECPIQIRVRLEVVTAFERLVEGPRDSAGQRAFAGGLLLGDTASPGVTEVAGIEPLAVLDGAAVEAAIGKAEHKVVGFFRMASTGTAQPGACLRMTEHDAALAAGYFHQPSSVVLLIEIVETAPAKATFFFWDNGKMLDSSLMDFPLDSHQLASLERQRSAPRNSSEEDASAGRTLLETDTAGIQTLDAGKDLEAAEAHAGRKRGGRRTRAAWIAGALAILGIPAYFCTARLSHRALASAGPSMAAPSPSQSAAVSASAPGLGFTVDRQGTDLLLSWDSNAPAVTRATFGVVLIRENGRTRNVGLTPEQLRSGSVRYKPASDKVEIELNVATGDHLTKESVIAVLP